MPYAHGRRQRRRHVNSICPSVYSCQWREMTSRERENRVQLSSHSIDCSRMATPPPSRRAGTRGSHSSNIHSRLRQRLTDRVASSHCTHYSEPSSRYFLSPSLSLSLSVSMPMYPTGWLARLLRLSHSPARVVHRH